MRPLKIALLSRWYAEENRRMAGRGPVQQLAEAVADLGHEVVVLSQSKEVAALTSSRLGRLETWLSPRDQRRGGWTGLRDKLAKGRYGHRKVHSDALDLRDFLAARGPFDVLWAQCEEPDGLVAAVAAQKGIALPPTVTQIFALRFRFDAAGRPIFTGRDALRAAFTQATRVLADSELVAAHLEPYTGRGLSAEQLRAKTRLMHHNVQEEFFATPAEAAGPEPGRVLFIGALNVKRGALVFLDATRRVEAWLGATFAMAGGVTERDAEFDRAWERELAATHAAGVSPELLGKISSTEIIAQIRRASVVVLPSLFDEFPRAVLEMLALGRAVVTTETVGSSVFVRAAQAGVIVPAADPAALARGIGEALREAPRYAENARRYAPQLRNQLSPRAIASQLVRHMTEIVAP